MIWKLNFYRVQTDTLRLTKESQAYQSWLLFWSSPGSGRRFPGWYPWEDKQSQANKLSPPPVRSGYPVSCWSLYCSTWGYSQAAWARISGNKNRHNTDRTSAVFLDSGTAHRAVLILKLRLRQGIGFFQGADSGLCFYKRRGFPRQSAFFERSRKNRSKSLGCFLLWNNRSHYPAARK